MPLPILHSGAAFACPPRAQVRAQTIRGNGALWIAAKLWEFAIVREGTAPTHDARAKFAMLKLENLAHRLAPRLYPLDAAVGIDPARRQAAVLILLNLAAHVRESPAGQDRGRAIGPDYPEPTSRAPGRPSRVEPESARNPADEIVIPLIKRSEYKGVHSGQLALPGGAFEPNDETLWVTALREAEEEIGLDRELVRPLGWLPPVLVPVSGFQVTPFVAWTARVPVLAPHEREVASIVSLPLSALTDRESLKELPAPPGSAHSSVFEVYAGSERVWGATARILASLAHCLADL